MFHVAEVFDSTLPFNEPHTTSYWQPCRYLVPFSICCHLSEFKVVTWPPTTLTL